jgi:hypothetical protein
MYYFLHFTFIHPSLLYGCGHIIEWRTGHTGSVLDPNPEQDPRVFWPPGSGSFYHHAKVIRKILNPTIL